MRNPELERVAAYNAVGLLDVAIEHGLNSRPLTIPLQTTATPTAPNANGSTIITIGENPWILNEMELGTISGSGPSGLPQSFFLRFNVYDMDNEGLFGGPTPPRASTVFGNPIQIAYAIQPVKVFLPGSKMKINWTNLNGTSPLGFEMFFRGIEILGLSDPGGGGGGAGMDPEELKELLEEMVYERRTR